MSNKNIKRKKTNVSPTNKEYKRQKVCRFCGTKKGLIRKYNLYICRRCFNEVAPKLGFKKYD